jgi:hypothetical protein
MSDTIHARISCYLRCFLRDTLPLTTLLVVSFATSRMACLSAKFARPPEIARGAEPVRWGVTLRKISAEPGEASVGATVLDGVEALGTRIIIMNHMCMCLQATFQCLDCGSAEQEAARPSLNQSTPLN